MVAVIPSWNGRHLLDETLASIAAQTQPVRALVVDNGSTDGTIRHLEERWSDVAVLALPRNQGFAAAVNAGVAASRGELVALVNNDVRLDREWAARMVAALERAPRAGSAASKVLSARSPDLIDATGDIVGWDGYCQPRGRGEVDRGQYDEPATVLSASAGAAVYRRAALEAVGPFDERFFAYIEDVDWGFRAQLAGYDCVYEPGALAYHLGGVTSATLDGFERYHAHRNMIWLMVKDFPGMALVLYAPLAIARRAASLVKAARQGQATILLRAWLDALRGLPVMLRQRREIQRRRVRSYRELARLCRTAPRSPVRSTGTGTGRLY